MRFKRDVPVFTKDGKEVGQIGRVVLNPKSKEVSHVVVHRGMLLSEDKVVPLDLIGSAHDQQVTLRVGLAVVGELPVFEEAYFVRVEQDLAHPDAESALAIPWLPMLAPVPPATTVPSPTVNVGRNIPPGTVALKAGARVIAADGKIVGKVEEVLTDSKVDKATEIVVTRGGPLKKTKRRLPVRWVYEVKEGEVHLAVGSHTVQELETRPA